MPESIPSVGNSVPSGPILPDAFDQFIGDTFYRQMLKSMRSGTGNQLFYTADKLKKSSRVN
jgi:hypothetical protein